VSRVVPRRPVRTAVVLAGVLASSLALGASTERGTVLGDPGPGYFATANVEWLGMIPFNSGSAGARVLDDRLYVTDPVGITIYDLADPTLPVPISFTPSPQQYYFTEEDVDTNGEILVVGSFGEVLPGNTIADTVFVYDVSDPTPTATLLGRLSGVDADQHTLSCILDCTYVYGSGGAILDLTDPTAPALVGNWLQAPEVVAAGVRSSHDVTEVAPGLVVTSSNPVAYLDVTDPRAPKVLSTGKPSDGRFIHGNLWPQGGTDDLLLVGGETFLNCNTTTSGAFMTFDATAVRAADEAEAAGDPRPAASFTMLDEYRVGTGLYTDGKSPYNQYCAHWFTTEPDFDGGGLVAAAWYEHGTRFLDIAENGEITEAGYFVPLGGSQSAAYFVGDDIVLTTDYQRGIDILRFDRDAPADEVRVGMADAVAAGLVDPNSFFPWFGRSTAEIAAMRQRVPDSADAYRCPLPFSGTLGR
jgi:hypothetical protein